MYINSWITWACDNIGNGGGEVQLQNSYIFLNNPYKPALKKPEKKENNVIHIDIGKNVSFYIEKAFPGITNHKDQDWYYRRKLRWVWNEGKMQCDVEFRITEVIDTTYLDIVVEGKSKSQVVKCLEYIQKTMQDSGIQTDYIMVISYDAISEYYCNKVYPKLNELERNLRKLLFNIYIVNFGKDYYKATVSEDLQAKIKSVIRPRGGEQKKETTVLQEFFYSFEFNDIQNLLFVPKWTDIDIHEKNAFLADNDNLSALSDETLRTAFKRFEPKSDWDRFFSSKITDIDFETVINTVRVHRNAVAHCKFFYRDSYKECARATTQLNKAILLAIKLTEQEDFAKKNNAAFRESMVSMKEAFAQYAEKLSGITKQLTQAMSPTISQRLGELTMNSVSSYFKHSIGMKSALSKIAESFSVSGMLKDAFKPLNISEILSEAYQIPPVEDTSNPQTDEVSPLLVGPESGEELTDDIGQ